LGKSDTLGRQRIRDISTPWSFGELIFQRGEMDATKMGTSRGSPHVGFSIDWKVPSRTPPIEPERSKGKLTHIHKTSGHPGLVEPRRPSESLGFLFDFKLGFAKFLSLDRSKALGSFYSQN